MKLHISDTLSLPLEAVTETFAVMGIRGSGKTHTASVMAEEMLKAGQPIVVYDPTGAWFGLKTSADGKRAGFPVVIFGGEHPDVPLEETAGATIASVVVEKRIPAILDVSLLRKGARLRFMSEFCETLYHKNREALHFFVDEAHTIAPQKAFPEVARVLGAMEDIVLQGRRRGLGLTVISQRPALVNTNIRTQCSTLVAMRIVGPHDLKAIEEWTDAHGTAERTEQMMTSLATLPKGEGWVWSVWLDLFRRVQFRRRETFDSSATPEVGKRAMVPKVVAEIDLAKLGEQIKATVEKAKADDPRELRRQIADLQRQLRERPAETKVVEKEKIVEVPVLKNGQLDKALKLRDGLQELVTPLVEAIGKAMNSPPVKSATFIPKHAQKIHRPPPIIHQRPEIIRDDVDGITSRQRRFLDAAATLATLGVEVTRETVAAWVGVHPRGGSVGEELKALHDAGLVVFDRGRITVTEAGMAQATQLDPSEAIERAKAGLSARQRNFFEMIVAAYPDEITREQIAEQFQLHPRGGSLGEDLGRLVGRGLVDGNRGRYRARDFLFA